MLVPEFFLGTAASSLPINCSVLGINERFELLHEENTSRCNGYIEETVPEYLASGRMTS